MRGASLSQWKLEFEDLPDRFYEQFKRTKLSTSFKELRKIRTFRKKG